MRFESVTAHAFGALVGRALHFAEGMTVVYGLNEAGKSTWHAALYAGLCGVRRGRGAATSEDRAFRDRHRPWDGGGWEVSATIALEDGRRVELRHDLEGKVACRAQDAILGRDCSGEIMHDGAPDGSRWLDLNRRSFLATACVQQADLLAVPENPGLLQQHLQRAAATSGTDATAAEALKRLAEFHSAHVGQARAHSARPLRRAIERVEEARRVLEVARREHEGYRELLAGADALGAQLAAARRKIGLMEAARAMNEALVWKRRAERARELAEAVGEGPPPSAVAGDALAQAVAATLEAWAALPEPPRLDGASAAALRAQLASLPPVPEGDLEPRPEVLVAREELREARRGLELHRGQRPAEPPGAALLGVTEDQLRDLAHELAASQPAVDPELLQRVERARQRAGPRGPVRPSMVSVALGGLVALVGVALLALGLIVLGLLLTVLGGGGAVWCLLRHGGGPNQGIEELQAAEAALAGQQHAIREAAGQRDQARAWAEARGLPVEPEALRRLASELAEARRSAAELERWAARERELDEAWTSKRTGLVGLLQGWGIVGGGDPEAAVAAYEAACRQRAVQASAAARRSSLEAQVAARQSLEAAAAEAEQRRRQAESRLREIAPRVGLADGPDAELVEGLRRWQAERVARLGEDESRREAWVQLQDLLDGRSPADLELEARQHASRALRLAAGFFPEELAASRRDPDLEGLITRLHEQLNAITAAEAEARGEVQACERRLRDVADAEEELTAAEDELERVRRLDRTLQLTRYFLESAQERIHRDIAPVLAASVQRWLPKVTAGRYREVRVDPETLKVTVCGPDGRWRDAGLLSRGTAEQVYLLLRVALAEHLTRKGEVCPLVLDDVTVQCDGERTEAVLRALHAISRERQVIVFTQEKQVLAWAEANLQAERDAVARLDRPQPIAIAAA